MIGVLILRRLKPGAYDRFRDAWRPERWWPGLQRVVLARHDDDPDVAMTWALLDLDDSELEAMRDDPAWIAAEARRMEKMAEFEEELMFAGFFHVVEDIAPTAAEIEPRHSGTAANDR